MKRRLPLQGEPRDDSRLERAPAWLAMGFRPLFLVAGIFAVVATGVWLHALATARNPSADYLPLTMWHAHEMVFGFTLAVVAGFLLTAARNWTGRDTLHGYGLLALVAVWLAGRVSMVSGAPGLGVVHAVVGVAFPLGLAVAVGRVVVRARSKRNYGLVVVVGALTVAALMVHLEANGVVRGVMRPAMYGALHGMVVLVVVIGGRIIPMFTRNRTGAETRKVPAVDRAAILLACAVAALAVADVATTLPGVRAAFGVVAGLSGVVQLFRMRTWGTGAALRVPMLAVLHAGYGWVGVGHLLILVTVLVPGVAPTVVLHALTIGVIGTMTIGMMARVAMGHTGREIRATPSLTVAFVAMNLAALVRLLGAVVPPAALVRTWHVSGALFALAFAVYVLTTARWLVTPRPDGRPG